MVTQEKMPQVLWHYTTQVGLLGIIGNGAIHASNIFYLNDAAEYKYAVKVLSDMLNVYLETVMGSANPYSCQAGCIAVNLLTGKKKLSDQDVSMDSIKYYFIKRIAALFNGEPFYHIYILSFSAEEDDLSQWRGYCPNGNGFSIGFRRDALKAQMSKNNMFLSFSRCLYEKPEQEDVIKPLIDQLLEKLESTFQKEDDKEDAMDNLVNMAIAALLAVIPRIKDSSFKAEREWRYIYINLEQVAGQPVKFRTGKSMLVPYLEIPLAENKEGKRCPIKVLDFVIVGPTQDEKLSKQSVEEMLRANGITLKSNKADGCEVKLSKIPYRIF